MCAMLALVAPKELAISSKRVLCFLDAYIGMLALYGRFSR